MLFWMWYFPQSSEGASGGAGGGMSSLTRILRFFLARRIVRR